MLITKILNCFLFVVMCLISLSTFAQTIYPNGVNGNWNLVGNFSDEFNSESTDNSKWDNDVKDWGTWSWEPDNAYQKNGNLHIRMAYQPHKRGKQEYFLTSGIYKSKSTITYGYFEARIKAASVLPGTCPAFWMKGDGPGKQNCEVDFLEYRESNPLKYAATNLHAFVDTLGNGKPLWIRENRNYEMPWDPREDFHIYGCETSADSIIWYIDGKKVNATSNRYWHFPQYVMLSMGVRAPYRTFKKPLPEYPEGESNYPDPVATKRDKDLFPTEMVIDYIRVWTREK